MYMRCRNANFCKFQYEHDNSSPSRRHGLSMQVISDYITYISTKTSTVEKKTTKEDYEKNAKPCLGILYQSRSFGVHIKKPH